MGEQKEEDLYRNFSRKDLQGLCKKYGLPANKSNSEMATSLILFLEKKNLSSRGIWEGTSADPFVLSTTELQSGVRMTYTDDMRKDFGRTASHSGSGNNQRHSRRVAKLNELQQCQGFASDKGSEDRGVLTQLYRQSNTGAGIQENTFSSVVSSSVVSPSPTFTYDVLCEDGIQLFVDLDSSPTDWIESLKAGVHMCHDMHKPKSQSFHEDIGLLSCSKQKNGSAAMDPSFEADRGQLEDGSTPTTIVTDIQAQTDEAEGGNALLSTPGLRTLTNAGLHSDNLQAKISSKLESEMKSRSKDVMVADLDVNSAVQIGVGNYSGNSLPSDPICSEKPACQVEDSGDGMDKEPPLQQNYSSLEPRLKCSKSSTTVCVETPASTCAAMSKDMEHSPSRVGQCVDLAEQSENAEMVQVGTSKSVQNTLTSKDDPLTWPVEEFDQSKEVSCSPVSNSLSLDPTDNGSKVDADLGKASLSKKSDRHIRAAQTHSAENAILTEHELGRETDEMQKKDAALYPCRSDQPLTEQNGVDHHNSPKTTECEDERCRNPSTANVETLGKSSIGSGREGLECLNNNNNNLMEKPKKRLADSESSTDLKKKRQFNSVEGQNKFVNEEAMILRSSKQFSGDAHSERRRSSRLFTK